MVKLELNTDYEAKRVRRGTSERGDWELIVLQVGNGNRGQQITIFPTNVPTGLMDGGCFQVKSISAVTVKKAKNKDGSWGGDVTSVDAEVEPAFGSTEESPFDIDSFSL